jgi:alpha-ketoglutarate-dependent 2,4-dichlorophenoxyacetate dioxygenase
MTATAIEIEPLAAALGARIRGVDLARPLDDATERAIRAALDRHLLVCFPDQRIDEAEQIAFSRRFGELQVHVLDQYRHPAHPEIYVLSNVDPVTDRPTGTHPDRGTLVWHSDLSFQPRPAFLTILYGREVPGGGHATLYADMRAAYDALGPAMQTRLAGLRAIHELDQSRRRAGEPPMTETQRRAAPPVEHPVVRRDPVTGRKSLYVSYHVAGFAGLPEAEGRALLESLVTHATGERFTLAFRWQPHDVVMWDNRWTMHCATGYDTGAERRVIHRTVVLGEAPE